MFKFNIILEIVICIQLIIISKFLPVYFSIPFTNKFFHTFELPITWQVPTIILITIIFGKKIVSNSFSFYLMIGIFFIPVFHQGGSLGYLLTPNFGYLIGTYPLIKIIDNSNKKDKINIINFLKKGFLSILALHLTGILYNFIQMALYSQFNILN